MPERVAAEDRTRLMTSGLRNFEPGLRGERAPSTDSTPSSHTHLPVNISVCSAGRCLPSLGAKTAKNIDIAVTFRTDDGKKERSLVTSFQKLAPSFVELIFYTPGRPVSEPLSRLLTAAVCFAYRRRIAVAPLRCWYLLRALPPRCSVSILLSVAAQSRSRQKYKYQKLTFSITSNSQL